MKLNERELANTVKVVISNGVSKLGDVLFESNTNCSLTENTQKEALSCDYELKMRRG